ncbi:nickel transporter [Vreelandella alkaliphila]|uniref:Nickel transporter n=1 Tax=Vreelandella alkaliphila TaxID=272774 RepID=A0ABX4HJP4_9GAMM|nr:MULTISPECIES: transporter substrate-binding domain-containing protein [Halomonas]AYF35141.1 nickel transporter [Halomonas alkaliphila]MCD6003295.1 transporter substrate-binding domain-containing protein [Halomonas sp. IOP_6]MCD6438694.1 transporter substrate-binding domain-containing protein [Halomonas sp.]PAU72460.1 nickel transporter [Halomonas humidisoli]
MPRSHIGIATALTSLLFAVPAYSDDPLRLAVDVPFEPFEYRLPDGTLTGFEVELGEEVCRRIERECEWVEQGWDGIIPGLLARKYDAIMSSMAITDARREQVLFSEPYYSNPSVWVTQEGKEIDIEDHDALEGISVGVQRGTIRDEYITDTYGDLVDVRRYATGEDLAVDIRTGRLDAAFMYYPLALSSLEVNAEGSGIVTSSPLIREPKHYFGHGVAAAFHPRNEALAEQFNEALREIKQDGTYDELMNKYVDYDIKI